MRPPSITVAQILPNLACGGVQELAALFAELGREAGVATVVAALREDTHPRHRRRLQAAGASVAFFPGRKTLDPRRVARLGAWLRALEVDLVHAHMRGPIVLGSLAAAAARLPFLAGIHLLEERPGFRAALRGRLEATLVRRLATGVVACGPEVARASERRFGPVPPTHVILNPSPLPAAARAAARDAAPVVRLVAVGRLSPEKALDRLLLAAARAGGHRLGLTIVGDGPERARLEALASGLGLAVRFTGWRDDVARILDEHDVYVSASRAEGLSLALLEAMARGLPVVAMRAGDAGLVVDRSVGRLVEQDDDAALALAIGELAADAELRSRLGAAAASRARRDLGRVAWRDGLAHLYHDVVARSKRGPRLAGIEKAAASG